MTRRLVDVSVGDALPTLAVPITTAIVVGGAIATRDFTPVHHDATAARAQGLPNVIMNTLTTNGFVCRYATDWAGPGARVSRLAVKLGVPNTPGETMTMTGRVAAKDDAAGTVELAVTGANAWGDHVTATVTVALPKG